MSATIKTQPLHSVCRRILIELISTMKYKLTKSDVKKYALNAYTHFDMCVTILFSPFAGVLYTVTLEMTDGKDETSLPQSPSVV